MPRSTDSIFGRLKLAGWNVGETGWPGCWLVYGANGENLLKATGRTQTEAWQLPAKEAERLAQLHSPGCRV